MKKIPSKFCEHLLAPVNAFPPGPITGEFETTDGIKCLIVMEAGYNNSDGRFDEEFDRICQEYFGCPFSTIRSIWFSRLGSCDKYWHLIKMVKI